MLSGAILGTWTDLRLSLKGGPQLEDDMEVARAGQELNQEVNRLMVAMRDMLANIRFQEPPRDDNPYRDEEEWDWHEQKIINNGNGNTEKPNKWKKKSSIRVVFE